MAHFLLKVAFDLHPIVHYLLLYAICFAVLLINIFIKHYFTKNTAAIEKFLKKKQKNPYYHFVYGLANQEDKKVIASYRKLVTQKKYKKHYPLLTVVFSFYFEQLHGLEKEIEKIRSQKLRLYYDLWLQIKRKKQISSKELSKLKTKWMKEALLAELEESNGRTEQAKIHRENALKQAKGLSFYQLKKQYERKYTK